MKRLIFLNVIFTLFFSVYAEKIVNVGGKNIKTQMVDSARFDIRGTWKIIDQKAKFQVQFVLPPILF